MRYLILLSAIIAICSCGIKKTNFIEVPPNTYKRLIRFEKSSSWHSISGIPLDSLEQDYFEICIGFIDTVETVIDDYQLRFTTYGDTIHFNALANNVALKGSYIISPFHMQEYRYTGFLDPVTLSRVFDIYFYYQPIRYGKWSLAVGDNTITNEFKISFNEYKLYCSPNSN